ncbi:hypothetical protein [Ralstonia phage RSP15]|uniref:hypothetical protein n=1 Tax=Ralstonia phage RSP15 TaxID=1785960 RepID=UPI00074D409E|nr:hypothetical protein BH754_gp014 [Ralstonia phage RSP15]BAU39972.1 hypothetical protein [Ralstonia phage RSP15]
MVFFFRNNNGEISLDEIIENGKRLFYLVTLKKGNHVQTYPEQDKTEAVKWWKALANNQLIYAD